MNDNFYKNLELTQEFSKISDDNIYKQVPTSWFIVVSDVENSTKQIQNGKYKEVNMVGALTIISILNLKKDLDIPFIFGGDGSFLLIPQTILSKTKQALLAVKQLAKESYSLDLRVGIVPISYICSENKNLLIAKYKVSKDYYQAIIKGGGLEFADELLKKDETFYIKDKKDENFNLNISGLECRWEPIKSPKDENLTILIKAKEEQSYEEILEKLEKILGNIEIRNPIKEKNLILSFKDESLDIEASLYAKGLKKFFIRQKLKFINLLGKVLMNNKVSQWEFYKKRIVSTTDNEKFDDMLRMVVTTSFEQTKVLEEYLEKEFIEKKLVYGIHKSDSSLMTCLIFERHGRHIHFVDGSNGGYALASIELKNKLKGID